MVVLSQCPWAWVREWADVPRADRKKNAAYLEFKQSATDLMMEQGFRKVYPELEKYVTFQKKEKGKKAAWEAALNYQRLPRH